MTIAENCEKVMRDVKNMVKVEGSNEPISLNEKHKNTYSLDNDDYDQMLRDNGVHVNGDE
jgi:hypothetical protein